MTDLKGKVALVTGGSRGIGAATARELAERGADVAISYGANRAMADAVVAEIETRGGRAVTFRSDQSDERAPSTLVADVVEALGGLDILVANAGVFAAGPIDGDDAGQFDAMYDVNVKGTIAAIRAAAKILRDDGRIVVMSSSLSCRVGAPGLADYTASKAALEGYVKGAAHDLASRRITVNAIQAGPVDTDMNPHDGPIADWLRNQVALRRYARPEEIAAVIGFIASSEASYVNPFPRLDPVGPQVPPAYGLPGQPGPIEQGGQCWTPIGGQHPAPVDSGVAFRSAHPSRREV